MASAVRGMIGENQIWPSPGGEVSVRAPMKKIDRFGTPKLTLCARSSWASVKGRRISSPSWNLAPGIAPNFSWQCSHCARITFAGP